MPAKNTGRPTLCLTMIVKDEAQVIERCLRSVRDYIDYWVICDTGSEDDTMSRVTETLSGIPGEMHSVPWVDFGHNRSEAIRLARGQGDYLLVIDADMTLEAKDGFDLSVLDADGYLIRYSGPVDYSQVMLVRGNLPWRYIGSTHEYLHCDEGYSTAATDQLILHHGLDGHNRQHKFERDLQLLLREVEAEPDNPRAVFYLAQTLRDLGQWEAAAKRYRQRLQMEGWDEERWYAQYQYALMLHRLGKPWTEVSGELLKAYQQRPQRLEPLYVLARHHREAGEYHLAYLFSRGICQANYPTDLLFVERDVYDYLLAFEYAICCYWLGEHSEAIRVNNGLLGLPHLPAPHVEAVQRNRQFSLLKRWRPSTQPVERIAVVVPCYNAGRLLEDCVASLLAQEDADYQLIFVDDGSTDGSCRAVPADMPGVTLLTRKKRHGPVAALDLAMRQSIGVSDLVVVIDGEDHLTSPQALTNLRQAYSNHAWWLAYSADQCAGRRGGAVPFPDTGWAARSRELPWFGPLFTFRADLWRRLVLQDPQLHCLKDPEGRWSRALLEWVVGPPMLDVAGLDRTGFVASPLIECRKLRWRQSELQRPPQRLRPEALHVAGH